MLSRKNRLKQKDKIPSHYDKKIPGSAISGAFSSLPIGKNVQFVFIIPSRTISRATERNLLRRRARHIIKMLEKEWKRGVYSFYFKKEAKKLSFQSLSKELTAVFRQLEAR